MFNRYAVTYGDYVARRAPRTQTLPYVHKCASVEAAKAAVKPFLDGRFSDMDPWSRSWRHDEEEAAILPPVHWTDTAHGAIGVQFWSKDRFAYWIIGDAGNFFHRIKMAERVRRMEQAVMLITDIVQAMELAEAAEADKKEIRARQVADKREAIGVLCGIQLGLAMGRLK